MNDFVLGFGSRIENFLTPEQLTTCLQELDVYCSNYDIIHKETAVSTYVEQLPEEFKAFMIAKKVAGRAPSTLKLYGYHLVPFFYAIGKKVPEITDNDVVVYLYGLQRNNSKIGNHTLEHIRLILSSFFTWCHDNGYIQRNPMRVIQPIKYEQKIFSPIDDEKFERLRMSFTNSRDKAIFELLYSTGCRIGELVNLQLDDIDIKEREVHLFGKGQKHRFSYMNTRAVVALKDYLEERPESDNPHVFLTRKRPYRPVTDHGIQAMLRKYGVEMSMDGSLHPHLLRHQFATEWVEKGLPVTELQQILGHAQLRTTQDYYTLSRERTKADHKRFIAQFIPPHKRREF